MPQYVIFRNYGYAGAESADLIEVENEEEAEKLAWEFALERVDSWVEPYDPDNHDQKL